MMRNKRQHVSSAHALQLLLGLIRLSCVCVCLCNTEWMWRAEAASTSTSTNTKTSKKTFETTVSRRDKNLDHWDAETMAAYFGLDPLTAEPVDTTSSAYVGIDATVMFYASWCTNCHRFAPVYDTIATMLKAGTSQSNLILALFNCELNSQHVQLCNAVGVTHYPTIMFVGAGPYHDNLHLHPWLAKLLSFKYTRSTKSKSKTFHDTQAKADSNSRADDKLNLFVGPYGPTKLSRTVKFQGNLNIGDSVLDWIKVMKGLSTWYKWNHMHGGWLSSLRRLFKLPLLSTTPKSASYTGATQSIPDALPIGVPPSLFTGTPTATATTDTTTKSSYLLQKELSNTEEKMQQIQKDLDTHKLASSHAGFIIDAMLFPISGSSSSTATTTTITTTNNSTCSYVDVFTVMSEHNAWEANGDDPVPNMSSFSSTTDQKYAIILQTCVVDLTLDYCTRLSTKLTNHYLDTLKDSDSPYPSFDQMEQDLKDIVKSNEPYCSIFNTCYQNYFDTNECKPEICPFQNANACLYVGSCLSTYVKEEYEDLLKDSLGKIDAYELSSRNDTSGAPVTDTTNSARPVDGEDTNGTGTTNKSKSLPWGLK